MAQEVAWVPMFPVLQPVSGCSLFALGHSLRIFIVGLGWGAEEDSAKARIFGEACAAVPLGVPGNRGRRQVHTEFPSSENPLRIHSLQLA